MIKTILLASTVAVSLTMTAHADDWHPPMQLWHAPAEDEYALDQSASKVALDDRVITVMTAHATCWGDFVADPGDPSNQLYSNYLLPEEVLRTLEEEREKALREEASNPFFRSYLYLAMYCNSSGLLDTFE